MKGKALHLVLVGGAIFASFLIAEIVTRMFISDNRINRYCYHPTLGHIRDAGSSGTYTTSEFQVDVAYNSWGFRDQARTEEKSRSIYRIAMLGDSYVEGAQVPFEATFASKLEQLLEKSAPCTASDKTFEILNFGVSGYSTTQELLLLKTVALRFQPDLVIVGFLSGNDIKNNSILLDQGTQDWTLAIRPYYDIETDTPTLRLPDSGMGPIVNRSSLKYRLLDSSRLLSLLYSNFARSRHLNLLLRHLGLLSPGNLAALSEIPTDYLVYNANMTSVWRDAWRATTTALSEMRALLIENKVGLLVVQIPNREQVFRDVWERILDEHPAMRSNEYSWNLTFPNSVLEQELVALRIPFYDPLPEFRRITHNQPSSLFYFPVDGHFTPRGHALLGQLMFEYLKGSGIACSRN